MRLFLVPIAAALTVVAACACRPALAQSDSLCDSAPMSWIKSNCEGARDAWRGEDYDVYIFGHAHHGRTTYSPERIRELNERAWGGGIGKRYLDAKDHTHLLYAVAFKDSHFKPEYMVGYGWLTHWRPIEGSGLRLGLGFTGFVT